MLPHKILIIDDENDIASLMLQYLRMEGYDKVDRASNGLEGLEKYKVLSPDLVLMDIEMPVMDGYQSSCEIKAFDPEAKILVLTGNPDDTRAQKVLKEDMAFALLKKPYSLRDLGLMIHENLPSCS
ncbi:MAG: response regulator [Deltaproteobacteria bacterium]|jgi:two-component system, chemotaxis family, chemotaxis protein CheY|nr:response regulator [Deltaproteobacteria bacterium]